MVMFLMGLCSIRKTLSDEMNDVGQFVSHLLFISLASNTIWGTFAIIYNSFFYFGFFNTIINLLLLSSLVMSGFIQMARQGTIDWMRKSNIGEQILNGLNYYYNLYIVSKNSLENIRTYAVHILDNYVLIYGLIIYDKFVTVNSDLSDNNKSRKIMGKLNKRYIEVKDIFMQQYFQPYIFSLIESTMTADPFQNINNNYKLNTDMTDKFEKMLLDSEIDNLSDDSEDSPVNVQPVPDEQSVQSPPQTVTPEANRQILRKKIAAKKSARVNRNKQVQMNMKAPPNMNKMMETMMEGDNLQKMMAAFPPGQLNMSNPDDKQMELIMQMMQQMNKKN